LHGDETRDEREIIEYFPWFFLALAIDNISIFTAVRTFKAVPVLPSKTTTRINAAVIPNRFET
jgi:hypothetical protein